MTTYHQRYHTIVLGVGGMGSAAVYELARRGKRVLGLEKFDIPNTMGSSHGYTRIIRKAYYEDPSYVMLIKRAYDLWEELENQAEKELLVKTGSLDAGPADSWVFKGSQQSCVDHGLVHEVLTGREINLRYPGYQLPEELMGVYQPDGGFLIPEDSIVSYVEAAHSLGAEIHGRETALSWEPEGNGVRVITDRDQYLADRLVITAGAWNAEILPFLQGFVQPERQVLAWLQPNRPEYFKPEHFPVFNLLVPEGRFYGFPVHGVPGFKFGKYHHFEEIVQPDQYHRDPTLEDEVMLRDFASRYFPQGTGPTMSLVACMFTNSPDKHFIIDLHPEYPQVSFATGFSGHGFKFASVVGEIMADLADWGSTRHDIQLFNLARFTGQISELYQDHPALSRGNRVPRFPHHRSRRGLHPSRMHSLSPIRASHAGSTYRRALPDRVRTASGTRSARIRSAGRTGSRSTPRQSPVMPWHPQDASRFWDTTNPWFWEKDDVKPFW